MEKWAVGQADKIVCITEGIKNDLLSRYPDLRNKPQYKVIPNGYDPDDQKRTDAPRKLPDDKFCIVYTGGLGGKINPKSFLLAVQTLLARHPEYRQQISIHFIGHCLEFLDGKKITDYIAAFELEGIVHLHGFVSRQESFVYQSQADLLLLIDVELPEEKGNFFTLTGKIFDYMLSGKPVLGVAGGGPAANLIQETGIGEWVHYADQEALVNALQQALAQQFPYHPNIEAIERNHYQKLARELETFILDSR
jgi:glycosyltransferase involved in cell wall biosynthesis